MGKSSVNNNSLTFIDLFSGCGGLSCGLEMAGHRCLLGVDMDKDAIESFKANHAHAQGVVLDIAKLTKSKLNKLLEGENVDMVVGGPPCQGFSTVGKGDAGDERNSLFKEFVRVVRVTNPKVVLFENVTGILAKKNEPTLKKIFRSFERLGYTMDAKVLSADDYKVPSRRRRTIIMGVKNGEPLFPQPARGAKVSVKQVFKKLAARKRVENHEVEKARLSSDIDKKRLKHIPAGAGIRYEKDEKAYLPKRLRYDVDWKTVSEGRFRQTKLQRLPWDEPAPTILTSRSMYYHPAECRYLTVREAALCQSFPMNFVFKGSVTAQFRQIGNAVPPLLAKSLGEEIKNIQPGRAKNKKALKAHELAKSAFSYREKRQYA